jgi:hypothetical protein
MANEVKIKLTDAQKEKIREATGKDMPEIRVESFGGNAAMSPTTKLVSARATGKSIGARASGKSIGARASGKSIGARATGKASF